MEYALSTKWDEQNQQNSTHFPYNSFKITNCTYIWQMNVDASEKKEIFLFELNVLKIDKN